MDPSFFSSLSGPSSPTQSYASSSRMPYHVTPNLRPPTPFNTNLNAPHDLSSVPTPTGAVPSHATHEPKPPNPAPNPAPPPPPPLPLVEPHQSLDDFLETFWTRQMDSVENEEIGLIHPNGNGNGGGVSNSGTGGGYSLPLARIKKVMKSDEDVKMISAEVPIMFAKACEIFISELSCRAWLVAESHKRRTLQKSDVAAAIAFSDMFDFLIDIVPRDDGDAGGGGSGAGGGGVGLDEGDAVVAEGGELGEVGDVGDVGEVGEDGERLSGVGGGDGNEMAGLRAGEDLYNEFVDSDG